MKTSQFKSLLSGSLLSLRSKATQLPRLLLLAIVLGATLPVLVPPATAQLSVIYVEATSPHSMILSDGSRYVVGDLPISQSPHHFEFEFVNDGGAVIEDVTGYLHGGTKPPGVEYESVISFPSPFYGGWRWNFEVLLRSIECSFGEFSYDVEIEYWDSQNRFHSLTFTVEGRLVNDPGCANLSVSGISPVPQPIELGTVYEAGRIDVNNLPLEFQFQIQNLGSRELDVTAIRQTSFSGPTGVRFEFENDADLIPSGGSLPFHAFLSTDSQNLGVFTTGVSIEFLDGLLPSTFIFIVSGEIVRTENPIIRVTDETGQSIDPNKIHSLGKVPSGSGLITKTFYVYNDGTGTLRLDQDQFAVTGVGYSEGSLPSPLNIASPPDRSTFSIRFDPSNMSNGVKPGTVTIGSNAANGPFTFQLSTMIEGSVTGLGVRLAHNNEEIKENAIVPIGKAHIDWLPEPGNSSSAGTEVFTLTNYGSRVVTVKSYSITTELLNVGSGADNIRAGYEAFEMSVDELTLPPQDNGKPIPVQFSITLQDDKPGDFRGTVEIRLSDRDHGGTKDETRRFKVTGSVGEPAKLLLTLEDWWNTEPDYEMIVNGMNVNFDFRPSRDVSLGFSITNSGERPIVITKFQDEKTIGNGYLLAIEPQINIVIAPTKNGRRSYANAVQDSYMRIGFGPDLVGNQGTHKGTFSFETNDLGELGLYAITMTAEPHSPSSQAASMFDRFTNTPARYVGAQLNGTPPEVGDTGVVWAAHNSVVFGANVITNSNSATGGSHIAGLPFNPAQHPDKPVATVAADVKVSGSEWIGLGFSKSADGGYWGDGQVWLLLKSNGRMELWANGTKHYLGGPQAPGFKIGAFNNLRLQYNRIDNSYSVWVNGVSVLDQRALDAFGFRPAIAYAGFHMYNANLNTQGQMMVDNFVVSAQKETGPVETDPPRLWVGKPAHNEILAGVVALNGWATDASGVGSVIFSLDGQPITLQGFVYGTSRADVCQTHSDLNDSNCPNVGWAGTLDTRSSSNGAHTLQMIATDARGNKAVFDRRFTISNQTAPNGVIQDSFTNSSPDRDPGDLLHGTKTEVGNAIWVAYNTVIFGANTITNKNGATGGSHIAGVAFSSSQYPDKPIATVTAEVKVTGSQWIGIGFSKSATGGYWGDGQAWMLLRPNGGMEIWANGTKHFLGGPQAPQFNATGFNALAVQYNAAENTVSASVNGVVVIDKRSLSAFGFMPDIRYAGFHMYNGNSGTQGQMQIDNFSVRVDQAGTPSETTPPKIWIGKPANNESVAGNIAAYGWALDASGVTHVSFQLDGQPLTLQGLIYGTPRQDVCDANSTINDPKCPNVGWSGNLDTQKFVNGTHTLRMIARDAHGNQEVFDRRFVIDNQAVTQVKMNDVITMKSYFNRYLVAESNGQLNADRTQIDSQTEFKLLDPDNPVSTRQLYYGDTIALRAFTSKYVVAEYDGTANANRDAVGPWEKWIVVNSDNPSDRAAVTDFGKVALRSWQSMYLVAEYDYTVNANRTTTLAWETWTLIKAASLSKASNSSGVEMDESVSIPREYSLEQNYPNPFNPSTTIGYGLPKAGYVTLKIYNLQGQLVRTLVDASQPAGQRAVNWDGKNESGQQVPSGTYLYRLVTSGYSQTKRMVLMK